MDRQIERPLAVPQSKDARAKIGSQTTLLLLDPIWENVRTPFTTCFRRL